MEVLHPRCAGLDVHKETVVACMRLAIGQDAGHHVERLPHGGPLTKRKILYAKPR